MGLPTATFVAADFIAMARLVNEANHASELPIVQVPSPFQALNDQELVALAGRVTEQVLHALSDQLPERKAVRAEVRTR